MLNKKRNVASCRKMEEQSSLTNCHTGGNERRYRSQVGEKEKQTRWTVYSGLKTVFDMVWGNKEQQM